MSSADADLIVDLDAGGRLASLRVGGHELLVTAGRSPVEWGFYPMAPYAGRVRDGRFTFQGERYELPREDDGHALHGTVYLREWEQDGDTTFVTDLGPAWPFPGYVRHDIRLGDHSVELRLEVHATEGPMPASCGWHPWFRRHIADARAQLDFRPGFMLRRDEHGIATREPATVPEGPWDDCFGGVEAAPTLQWPGYVLLSLATDSPWWVVYDERDHALCLEPQTAPPDTLNHDPFIVKPGEPLVASARLKWTQEN